MVDKKSDLNSISVVTCSMNREQHLLENIKYIKKLSNITEHIVVDYSSLQEVSKKINDTKIKIFRIDNEIIWWHNKAYNSAFHLANSKYILKIDADVLIDFKKFNKIEYKKYDLIIFYNNENDPGNFLITKDLLSSINGFNEYMWQWGWQDHDIISRAIKSSKNIRFLKVYNAISKIDHDNAERNKILVNKIYKRPDHFYYSYMKATNDTNVFLASKNLWSSKNILNYDIIDNKLYIKHNYDIKNLNFILKLQYKWKICYSFSVVYKSKTKFIKRLLALSLFLTPKYLLLKYFSIKLYI